MNDEAVPKAKVLFRVPDMEGTVHIETLWATPLGADRYKLDNSPFYAFGVSWADIVLAPLCEEEHFPVFQQLVHKSRNRKVRVIFDPPVEVGNRSHRVLQGLEALGCSYEGASRSYIAVNIPPRVDLEEFYSFLLERNATWEYVDPTYDDLFPQGM